LGVNGFVWVSRFVEPAEEGEKEKERLGKGKMGLSISNLDEMVSNEIYSSQNDEIDGRTRREIARLCGCITLLAEQGVRVDEDTVLKAYAAAMDAEMESMLDDDDENWGAMSTQMKSQLHKRIVQAVVGAG
jgi:exosome complex component RRP4